MPNNPYSKRLEDLFSTSAATPEPTPVAQPTSANIELAPELAALLARVAKLEAQLAATPAEAPASPPQPVAAPEVVTQPTPAPTNGDSTAEALRVSIERYQLAVDGSNDGIWDWDITTNVVYFSPRWKSLVGYADHEVENNFGAFEALLHPDDHDRVLATVGDYLAGKIEAYAPEFRFKHKDGSYRWILARGRALRDAEGKPFRMAGSHTDITERKQAEEDLRVARQRFELAVDGSNDGIWDWDIATNVVYFSPRWKAMVGYADHEVENNFGAFEALLHPDDRERVLSTVGDYLAGKLEAYAPEFRFKHKDGSYRWILARGRALRDADGKPYRMAGSHTDITERKHAEVALQENKERHQALAEATREALIFHESGLIIDVNSAALELFGYGYGEVVGQSMLKFVAPESQAKVVERIQNPSGALYELTILRKDGTPVIVEGAGQSYNYQGRPIRVATLRDITERKRAEETLARRARELETLNVISQAVAAQSDVATIIRLAGAKMVEVFGVRTGYIALTNPAAGTVQLPFYMDEGELLNLPDRPIGAGLTAHVIQQRRPVLFNNIPQDLATHGIVPLVTRPNEPNQPLSWLGVPLFQGGDVAGVLSVQAQPAYYFTEADVTLMTTIAASIAAALQNTHLYAQTSTAVAELRAWQEATSAAAIVSSTNIKGEIDSVNDNFVKISQYSREELIGQDHRLLNSGYLPKDEIRNLWLTLANGQVWQGEFRNKAKDGSYYWVQSIISPILNAQGKPVRYLSISFDITQRKQLELETAYRAEELSKLDAITQKIQAATTVEAAMQIAARELGQALGMKPTRITLDPKTLHLTAVKPTVKPNPDQHN